MSTATARARTNGVLGSRKGLNLPGKALAVPSMTHKDRLDLEFGSFFRGRRS